MARRNEEKKNKFIPIFKKKMNINGMNENIRDLLLNMDTNNY